VVPAKGVEVVTSDVLLMGWRGGTAADDVIAETSPQLVELRVEHRQPR
jgi:hypothetical protein